MIALSRSGPSPPVAAHAREHVSAVAVRPWGVFFTQAEIDAALAETKGEVKAMATPFAGSRLFLHNDGKPHPGLVVLHGSDGGASGWNEMEALKWAKKGFAVLAYAYFGAPGTPPGLGGVDLDRARQALNWLQNTPAVGGQKLGIYGVSRGAEMAALLGSLVTDGSVRAIVAHSPQGRIQASFYGDGEREDFAHDVRGNYLPAWTSQGRALPEGAPIKIERFPGRLFLTHGTADEVWPASGTRELEHRLRRFGRREIVKYLQGERHATSAAKDAILDKERHKFLCNVLCE